MSTLTVMERAIIAGSYDGQWAHDHLSHRRPALGFPDCPDCSFLHRQQQLKKKEKEEGKNPLPSVCTPYSRPASPPYYCCLWAMSFYCIQSNWLSFFRWRGIRKYIPKRKPAPAGGNHPQPAPSLSLFFCSWFPPSSPIVASIVPSLCCKDKSTSYLCAFSSHKKGHPPPTEQYHIVCTAG